MSTFHMQSRTFNGYYAVEEIKATGMPVGNVLHIPVTAKTLSSVPWSTWQPGRVCVEAGIAKFADLKSAKAFLIEHTRGTVFAQVAETLEWPADAVYRVGYMAQSWPCRSEDHEAFFRTPEETIEFIAGMHEWSLYDGNNFTLSSLEEWDWGPVPIQESKLRAAA